MRNRKMLTATLCVAAILIAVVSVQAQTVWTYEAEIPFEFVVGDNTYGAGQFIIDLERPNYLANILTIRNGDGERLERNTLSVNGHRSPNDKTRLVFDRYEDILVLKEIIAPNFGFNVRRPGTATWTIITKNFPPERETVSIVLERPERNKR